MMKNCLDQRRKIAKHILSQGWKKETKHRKGQLCDRGWISSHFHFLDPNGWLNYGWIHPWKHRSTQAVAKRAIDFGLRCGQGTLATNHVPRDDETERLGDSWASWTPGSEINLQTYDQPTPLKKQLLGMENRVFYSCLFVGKQSASKRPVLPFIFIAIFLFFLLNKLDTSQGPATPFPQ